MDFLKFAKKRYSCRRFSNKKVEDEKIDLILEAARVAPTGHNNQPQRILIIQDEEGLAKIKECTPYGWDAKVMMLLCYDKNISWKREEENVEGGVIDASIVATHMMFEIHSLGLATTLIGAFDHIKIKELFNLPENIVPILILPVAYPADEAHPSRLHEERFPKENMLL